MNPESSHGSVEHADRRNYGERLALWWFIYLLLVAGPALALIFGDANGGRAAYDSGVYHERVIREYIRTFPVFDVANPLTTTIPGYHVLMAAFGKFVSADAAVLRLASLAIGLAFLAVAARSFGRWAGARNGLLLAMPLAACSYVLGASAWMLPDNLSWLLVTLCLMVNLGYRSFGRAAAWNAVLLLAAVACRQVNIWLWAVMVAAAASDDWEDVAAGMPARVRRAWVAGLAGIPALAILASFAFLWGGLTPPRFQADVTGFNAATPAFLLFQFAALGAFFLPWLYPSIQEFVRHRPKLTALIAIVALMIAAIPSTAPGECWGRFAGWWRLFEALPVINDHTTLPILLGAPLGAVSLVASICSLGTRRRIVMGTAVIAFGAAMTCTFYAWQRYHEPFILLLLGFLSAMQPREAIITRPWTAARMASIALLTMILSTLTLSNFSAERIDPAEPPAIFHLSAEERIAWDYEGWKRSHPGTRQGRELDEVRKPPRRSLNDKKDR
jgi:hypothetical protein